MQDVPRYGAERRCAPIFAYVRAGYAPIRERGNIMRPDLVVVADDTLVPIPAAGVLAGVTARTVLLINSPVAAADWGRRLNLAGPVVTLPAQPEVADRAELPFLGAMCAGAAARLVGKIGGIMGSVEQWGQTRLFTINVPGKQGKTPVMQLQQMPAVGPRGVRYALAPQIHPTKVPEGRPS